MCPYRFAILAVVLALQPMINPTVFRDAAGNPISSLYEYPDATVTFEGDVALDDEFGHGTFTARVPMFRLVVNEATPDPCDFPCGMIQQDVNFIDGQFDPEFAAFFGVQQHFESGSIWLFIGKVTGSPDSPEERTGIEIHNDGVIEAEAIPEPSSMMLCLLAVGALARRRYGAAAVGRGSRRSAAPVKVAQRTFRQPRPAPMPPILVRTCVG